jgi:4-amino-4-deoxy-L-arabinose transferase-like glycosyltransferase
MPDIVRLAIILLAAMATFSGALGNGFAWDDFDFIVYNSVLQDPANIPLIVSSGDAVGSGGTNPYYRPLTTISFMLDHALWGNQPAGYHATSVVLHLAACAALYFLLRRTSSSLNAGFAATLLFAVHPAHSEPVGYISARADLLCGFFLLVALLAYMRANDSGRRIWTAVSATAFALALLSKIVALIVPALIALHLIWVRREEQWWRRLPPYLLVAGAFLALHVAIVPMEGLQKAPLADRIASAGPILLGYVRNALFPWGLKLFYDIPLETGRFSPAVIAGWGGVVTVSVLAFSARRKFPEMMIGTAWFFGALLPVCGIVILVYPALMADRYLYIPLMGAAVVLATAGRHLDTLLSTARGRISAACVFVLLAGVSAEATATRIRAWKDHLALWEAAALDAPGSLFVQRTLGAAIFLQGKAEGMERAKTILEKAIAMRDDDPRPHMVLSRIGLMRGNLAEAEREAWSALGMTPGSPMALTSLGMVMWNRGNTLKAEELFRNALLCDPGYAEARSNLDRLLAAKGAIPWHAR